MKLTIEQPKLAAILAASVGIVERKNTIPILGNVKLAANGGLTVTASDLDMEAVTTTDADVTEAGGTTVPVSYTHLTLPTTPYV